MDKLDTRIIESLNGNARKSFRTIAKELKVSLSTVANRVKKMENEGIIEGYFPIIDLEKVGLDLTAVINLKFAHGRLIEVQKKISKDRCVSAVYDITGEWDSLVVANFKDRRDLNGFIKRVLSMEFVERSNTQIVLNIVKDDRKLLKI